MARSTKHVPVVGSERAPVPGARAIRPTAASERVEVTVRVRPRSSSKKLPMPEQLGALLPRDRKYLSRKQLDATHAADPVDLAKVKAFAKEHRLEVLKVSRRRAHAPGGKKHMYGIRVPRGIFICLS